MSDLYFIVSDMCTHHCFAKPEDPSGVPPIDLSALLKPPPPKHRRIRCPKCAWVPKASDRWMCREGCRHTWNTFDTQGRCPRCGVQWEDTKCLSCLRWSRHRDWYVDEPSGGAA